MLETGFEPINTWRMRPASYLLLHSKVKNENRTHTFDVTDQRATTTLSYK